MEKFISMILVVLMLCMTTCIFAACGDDDKKPADPTVEVTAEITEEPAATEEVVDTAEPEVTAEVAE